MRRRPMPDIPRIRDRIPAPLFDAISSCCAAKSPWPLFIHGNPGCGKTCAVLYLRDRHAGCDSRPHFAQAVRFVGDCRDVKLGRFQFVGTHGEYTPSESDWWDYVSRFTLFVLDDLGALSKATEHAAESILRLLDVRYAKPTAITSNLALSEIARVYDPRIASRLADGTVVNLSGLPDQRLQHGTSDAQYAGI